ncbi:MAG: tRNA 2-thiouridine(34) synthase MnmA [bacterium]
MISSIPKKRICLALSGGIDSTFAGWLLKQEGYEIIGVFLQLTQDEERLSNARTAADFLDIPLKILDLKAEFDENIIKPFINTYLSGETPNPCVLCNANIKCGLLLEWALENDLFSLATGHYARIEYDPETGNYLLLKGLDPKKDQSYFLYRLTQKQLSRLLFPLGVWTKKGVEEKIGRIGPHLHRMQESQEICFLPNRDYRSFLKKAAPHAFKSGHVCDRSGKRVGSHSGFPNYTIGQRKGLQLIRKGPNYVLSVDAQKNRVIIGNDEDLWQSELIAEDLNRIIDLWPKNVLVRIRSTQPAQEAYIEELEAGKVKVLFKEPVRAITPGQSVVFYKKDICLGGGIIRS